VRANLKRVPLFLVIPGSDVRREMPVVGGHVDIAPTLLYLLGLESPRVFLGGPLLPGGSQMSLILGAPRGSAVGQDRMVIVRGQDLSRSACFAFPSGDLLPSELCMELALRAKKEWSVSQKVVAHDLASQIAGAQTNDSFSTVRH